MERDCSWQVARSSGGGHHSAICCAKLSFLKLAQQGPLFPFVDLDSSALSPCPRITVSGLWGRATGLKDV